MARAMTTRWSQPHACPLCQGFLALEITHSTLSRSHSQCYCMTQVLHLLLDFPCLELICGRVIGHPPQRELVTGQEQVDDELREKVPPNPRGSSPFGAVPLSTHVE